VFAAASNAPLSLSVMAVELLGANLFPHVVIVSVLSYLLSGQRGIYTAQRLRRSKSGFHLSRPTSLRELRSVPPAKPEAEVP
jgi:H+/Cl- antiporter ClcA